MRLLLLEADAVFAETLYRVLRQCGHRVDVFTNGDEGALAIRAGAYDLLIFDSGLGGSGAAALLKTLRGGALNIPALALAAGASPAGCVRLLDLGADDCLAKPFDLAELQARIRALARRSLAGSGDNLIALGRLRFDLARRSTCVGGATLALSGRETDLLETLILSRNRAVSRARIRGRLCELNDDLSDGAIDLYVHRLRRKLGGSGVRIRTVRGFGYLLQQIDGRKRFSLPPPQP